MNGPSLFGCGALHAETDELVPERLNQVGTDSAPVRPMLQRLQAYQSLV